jgi:hypothetical protein
VDWGNAGQAALAGGYLAAPFGLAGRAYSDALHFTKKGQLGELLGEARTLANGEIPVARQQRVPVNGGPKTTAVDHLTNSGRMTEQKFGPSARLSQNQKAAYAEYGDRYRVDHFLPRDVGAVVAYPLSLFGYGQALNQKRR